MSKEDFTEPSGVPLKEESSLEGCIKSAWSRWIDPLETKTFEAAHAPDMGDITSVDPCGGGDGENGSDEPQPEFDPSPQ